MLFFKSEEDLKEFHQSMLRDHERGVKFIESNIEYHKKMAEIYRGSSYPGNRKMVEFHLGHLKKTETDLQEAKEQQKKAVEKYEAIYLTPQEKAVRKGLTVIMGGLCENA
ncbi:MAG: hypothetical protein CVU51_03035 [Deltaproteobacteria bacterium HGW-Deltaproteobacteria-1]|nr:MAG: hypothetical protein CVU51_03035 [Deltaproteobacteria bacterium HGW-Deltaproteobacteria-1]